MSRHQKDPLRPLTADERKELTRLSRSLSAPAAEVERARALLAIADGAAYTAQPTRSDDGTPRPFRPGLAASTATGSRPCGPATEVARGSAMALPRSNASWPNGRARPSASRTARRRGP